MNLIYSGKKHFHNNPVFKKNFAVFDAVNGIDSSSIGKKQLKFSIKMMYLMVII